MDNKKDWSGYIWIIIIILAIYFLYQDEIETWGLFEWIVIWGFAVIIKGGYEISKKIEKYEELEQKKIEDNYDANGKEKKRKKFLSFRDS